MFVNFRAGCTGRYQIGLLGLALKPRVRVWQVKLRMPMLLSTDDAVIAIAPIEGFLHALNTLDTLGTDQPEFACQQ